MTTLREELVVSTKQVEAFRDLSSDKNPLHLEADYARRSQFGGRIVYGVCGLLVALGRWAGGREVALASVRCTFRQPLFEGATYTLELDDAGSTLKVRIVSGSTICVQAIVTVASTLPAVEANATAFVPAEEAAAPADEALSFAGKGEDYALRNLTRLPALGLAGLPLSQVSALMWASYHVGMVTPGRQALFASVAMEFDAASEATSLRFSDLASSFDARFGQLTITGRGTGVKSLTISAFRRPEPVRIDVASLLDGAAKDLAGTNTFVTGSGRGFGLAMAGLLAAKGAQVLLHGRAPSEETDRAIRAIRDGGGVAELASIDLTASDASSRFGDALAAFSPLDLVVHSAFPFIPARGFMAQTEDELCAFVDGGVRAAVRVVRAVLPRMKEGGAIVLVSSVFTRESEPLFTHYIAAKAALEGLWRGLAAEHRSLRFVVIRPPRMLTDQTNSVLGTGDLPTAADVARRFVDRIVAVRAAGFHELDDETK